MTDIAIVSAARKAVGKFGGSRAALPAAQPGAVREVLRRNAKKGSASLCIGRDMGVALTLER